MIALVAGARPNFMKIAPLHAALVKRGADTRIVHTGQHHDAAMSGRFFEDLGLPAPSVNLGAGSGTPAEQLAAILVAFESWVAAEAPDLVVVVGDVTSTLAAALVASRAGVRLAHVEAGLRSFDRTMPEELNRLVVDQLADLLFVTEEAGVRNLEREGIPESRIHLVGNTMIDSLLHHREAARSSSILETLDLPGGTHVVATLHRPANVDDPSRLAALLSMLATVAQDAPVVFPLHPRTRARIEAAGRQDALEAPGLRVTGPLGYLDFLHLMATATAVLTDSGGIQEETTVLGVPCLTLRDNTERPVTIEQGTNTLAGTEPGGILRAWTDLRRGPPHLARIPDLWDGHAADRIADILLG